MPGKSSIARASGAREPRRMKRQLRTFAGLNIEELRHPSDASATEALKKIPGLDKLLVKILEVGLERMFYVEIVASNLRVTPKMFPRLHKSLVWTTKILDIAEPELYVTVDPVPNAWTYGHTKPFITLTSGLIDMMSDVGSCGAVVRAGSRGRALDVHEALRRHHAARRRDGSRGVPAPDPRVRGGRSLDARPRVQCAADGAAHAPVRDATREGARAVVRGRIRDADGHVTCCPPQHGDRK